AASVSSRFSDWGFNRHLYAGAGGPHFALSYELTAFSADVFTRSQYRLFGAAAPEYDQFGRLPSSLGFFGHAPFYILLLKKYMQCKKFCLFYISRTVFIVSWLPKQRPHGKKGDALMQEGIPRLRGSFLRAR
ncbi:MAG TPA: hypothetical protein PKZ65_10280, partial [Methanoregulaceae archaeon]|nr:hypothetical protein [Methanoregulaceae archaeon]